MVSPTGLKEGSPGESLSRVVESQNLKSWAPRNSAQKVFLPNLKNAQKSPGFIKP